MTFMYRILFVLFPKAFNCPFFVFVVKMMFLHYPLMFPILSFKLFTSHSLFLLEKSLLEPFTVSLSFKLDLLLLKYYYYYTHSHTCTHTHAHTSTHAHTHKYNSLTAKTDLLIMLRFSHLAGSTGCLVTDSFLFGER